MNTRLLLVRHGQTAWNADGRFMGQLDIPMDSAGRDQALALSRRMTNETPAAIYHSELKRARDTALAIQSAIASCPELRPDVRLNEMHFGDWQGQTYLEIKERDPQALARWESDPLRVAPPNGETLQSLADRVARAYQNICLAHTDETVIIAGHGGSLQALIVHALDLPLDAFWKIPLSNASLSELRIRDSWAALHLLNDTSHLSAIE